jgi:hypothetical protein
MRLSHRILAISLALGGVAGVLTTLNGEAQNNRSTAAVPVYQVDPFWPKPFKDPKWMIQAIPVMATDYEDHIWAISRSNDLRPDEGMAGTNPPRGDCCIAAPEILEFDQQGNLLNAWGNPTYHEGWPPAGNIHAIVVDKEHNVWISGSGRGNGIQKYTRDGKFLWDFGHRGPKPVPGQPLPPLQQNNQQTDILPNGVFIFTLDEPAHEIYLVEGKRVLVYGYDGSFKRGWGGHGMALSDISNAPTPPYNWTGGPPPELQEFAPALHCIHITQDGLVYVCERGMNRIQVFTKQGKFVTSFHVAPNTPARGSICDPEKYGMCGSTYNLTFSHDPGQQYALIADGTNHRIWIHDRHTGELKGSVGSPGRMAGQFFWIDAIASDSMGNIYTGEVNSGKRVQKFVLKNGDGVRRMRPLEY